MPVTRLLKSQSDTIRLDLFSVDSDASCAFICQSGKQAKRKYARFRHCLVWGKRSLNDVKGKQHCKTDIAHTVREILREVQLLLTPRRTLVSQ